MNPRTRLIINFIGFQVVWFACVLGGAHDLLWAGPVAVAPLIVWHLGNAAEPAAELRLLLIGTLLGSLFDQTLLSTGWIAYPESGWPVWLLPPWMFALWLGFCTTLNVSMRWLRTMPLIAVAFGAIGGPAAYWAGVKLGAMVWLQPVNVAVSLAVGWGLIMPLLFKLSTRLDGYANNTKGYTKGTT